MSSKNPIIPSLCTFGNNAGHSVLKLFNLYAHMQARYAHMHAGYAHTNAGYVHMRRVCTHMHEGYQQMTLETFPGIYIGIKYKWIQTILNFVCYC